METRTKRQDVKNELDTRLDRMKTGEVSVGAIARRKHFALIQDETRLVTAYAKDKDSGVISIEGIPLGKPGDIDDFEVQAIVIDRLAGF